MMWMKTGNLEVLSSDFDALVTNESFASKVLTLIISVFHNALAQGFEVQGALLVCEKAVNKQSELVIEVRESLLEETCLSKIRNAKSAK